MKNILCTCLFFIVIYGCNHSTPVAEVPEDSLQYYPPTPGKIDKQEFRRYNRILSSFFDSMLLNHGFNGGILVAKNGAVLYEKYLGYADLRKKDLLTDTTSFHIASTSKTFTSIAILNLIQQNKLSLSDSIQRFFPALPYPGVTVKMLLNHRSGLPNYIYFVPNTRWDQKKNVTNKDVLQILYNDKPAKSFSPGKHFSYSNTNFVLLALIVEKITRKPFPEYMKENFFQPLQMNHTYVYTVADADHSIKSFNYNSSVWDNDFLEETYGDKNIYSTPQDLLKWDQALYTDQLVGKALLDSAFTPYSNERPSVHNYGLGFRMLMLPSGKKVIYHFGRWHGFNSAFARLTDEKVTIIILGNKFNRNIYNTAHHCYDIFGDYYQNGNEGGENESPETSSKKAH
ncbi:MAG: serine hydrolase domain-containing protein [Chitinophagaceae bacterium]